MLRTHHKHSLLLQWMIAGLLAPLSLIAADIPQTGPIPFEAYDKDNNGKISPQEFVETQNQRRKMRIEAGLPLGGLANAPGFTFFDTNGDNQITPDELAQGQANRQNQQAGRGMGQGMGGGRNMPAFSDFDLNGNGSIEHDEFYDARAKRMYDRADQGFPMRNAASAPSFEEIDSNQDKKISPEEFKAHQLQHRRMRQQ